MLKKAIRLRQGFVGQARGVLGRSVGGVNLPKHRTPSTEHRNKDWLYGD